MFQEISHGAGDAYDGLGDVESDRHVQPAVQGDLDAVADLTPREVDVLLLLSRAASNREIGRALGIAERTVKAHLTSIMKKIAVRSRTEVAIFSFAHHRVILQHGVPSAVR
ncbi:helix-turn-helix transcriptional regulator [Streptomyces sp. NPDC056347]|uniref:helix-turn-helix domain-containing protein n=1 Tax=Streptomyces sp. NPDC056347 TaxID=3345790 RepID=UPI0035D8C849